MSVYSVAGHIRCKASVYKTSRENISPGSQLLFNVKPLLHLTWSLFAISICYVIVFFLSPGETAVELANEILPISLTLALSMTALKLVRNNFLMIWTPIPWFLLVAAMYYGLGPLIYHHGDPTTVAACNLTYLIDELSLFRVNMMVTMALGLISMALLVGSLFFASRRSDYPSAFNMNLIRRAAFIFLTVGLSIKVLLILPQTLGSYDFIVPGYLQQFGIFSELAIIPLVVLIHAGEKKFLNILFPLLIFDAIFCLIQFQKLTLLIYMLVIVLAIFTCYRRISILLVGLLIMFVTFQWTSMLVLYGRQQIERGYGSGIEDRIGIVSEYFSKEDDSIVSRSHGSQVWWMRLNYVPVQCFVLDAYEAGNPGDSFKMIFYLIIPRQFWSEKPILSDLGLNFHELVIEGKQTGTAFSPGFVAAEAYWDGGYPLAIIICFSYGLLLTIFTKYSFLKIKRGQFLYLPVVFIGLKIGLRPDAWILIELLGLSILAIVLNYMLTILGQVGSAGR